MIDRISDDPTRKTLPQRRRRIERRRQRRRGARANRVRQLHDVAAVKGRRERAKFVQNDAERPDVGGECVRLLLAHLGREVERSAVKGVDQLLLVVNLATDLSEDDDRENAGLA